jgi:hypothetical protein
MPKIFHGWLSVLLLTILVGVLGSDSFAETAQFSAKVSVSFSSNGGCTEVVIRELNTAKKRVLVSSIVFLSAHDYSHMYIFNPLNWLDGMRLEGG